MAKKILLGVVVVIVVAIVGLVIVVATQPSEFYVARSTTIDAPPADVFPHVNNFRRWQAWSPWAKLDPDAKYTYEGPESGEDAECHWDGNDDVGAGMMKIIESRPYELIRYDLKFTRPFEDECEFEFQLKPKGDGTEVTWVMEGENNFVGKIMCLFMDMEGMIGKDYDKGLANLKQVIEADAGATGENPVGEGSDSEEGGADADSGSNESKSDE